MHPLIIELKGTKEWEFNEFKPLLCTTIQNAQKLFNGIQIDENGMPKPSGIAKMWVKIAKKCDTYFGSWYVDSYAFSTTVFASNFAKISPDYESFESFLV